MFEVGCGGTNSDASSARNSPSRRPEPSEAQGSRKANTTVFGDDDFIIDMMMMNLYAPYLGASSGMPRQPV